MLKILLRPFFSTVLIGINLDAKVCALKIVILKNGHVKSTLAKEFRVVNNELPIEAAKLIKSYKRKYPFTYLSAMSKTYNQGLAHCANKASDLVGFGIDSQTSKIVEMPDGWLFYIQNLAIDENRVKFIHALGLDFLFSPFVLIYDFVKDQLTKDIKLYVLQERSAITLFVASRAGVYFGGFFMMGNEIEGNDGGDNSVLEVKSLQEMGDLESLIGSVDELNEIGELEDLDEELIRREFAPQEFDVAGDQDNSSCLGGLRDLVRSSNIVEILKNSINEFYTNPIYSAQFIDSVVLLDTYGMTEQAVEHIRNSLMLDVKLKRVEIPDMLIALAKSELNKERE